MIKKGMKWLGVPILCLLLAGLSALPVSADSGASVVRSIHPEQVGHPVPDGVTVDVQVQITANETLNGFMLIEIPPAGWEVEPVDNDGAAFKADEVKWLWAETLHAGSSRTVVYRLTVPAGVDEDDYTFSGLVKSHGIADVTVGGVTIVTVTDDPDDIPPVGGTAHPISRLPIVALWIALGAAIIAGASLLMRRRRATR